LDLVFDSGVASTLYLSEKTRQTLKDKCKVVDGKSYVNVFGVDLPFYTASSKKY
jgi:hypothetical protein